ncbi:MAG: type II toxin-antitoxin system HipA family toxin [Alphaproteobacteria bacterium]|nr:type II toxin-antitoxin system HipA family toxin [Alphaproteobacteria bacterium]
MKKSLTVWWDARVVGTFGLDAHGDIGFAYDPGWTNDPGCPPISLSLPKREQPFNRRECRPFFAGLLPEEVQRAEAARTLGVSPGNDFALLEKLGGDVAGALTLWPDGERPPLYDGDLATEPLGDNALRNVLDTLPTRPLLAGEKGLRLSLAGAQAKLPVVLIEGAIALPAPGQPTTHILKPPIPRLPGTTENEAFTMRLAAAAGLPVAAVEPRRVGDRPFLLVTRYDRTSANGLVRRVHQEDFCQALGIAPELKYAAEGGPTFKSGFALLRSSTARPALELLKLLDAALFNLMVGNADAHGKNFSLLYEAEGRSLAPLYDLLCTVAYPEISPKLAMKVGGAAQIDQVTEKTWRHFSEDIAMGAVLIRRRVGELAHAIDTAAPTIANDIAAMGFDKAVLDSLAVTVKERAARIFDTVAKARAGGQ